MLELNVGDVGPMRRCVIYGLDGRSNVTYVAPKGLFFYFLMLGAGEVREFNPEQALNRLGWVEAEARECEFQALRHALADVVGLLTTEQATRLKEQTKLEMLKVIGE